MYLYESTKKLESMKFLSVLEEGVCESRRMLKSPPMMVNFDGLLNMHDWAKESTCSKLESRPEDDIYRAKTFSLVKLSRVICKKIALPPLLLGE